MSTPDDDPEYAGWPKTRWFGEPWPRPNYRAPVCEDDAARVPTPVGEPCMHCGRPIGEDDQGTIIPGYVHADGSDSEYVWKPMPAHRQCSLRSVLGCSSSLAGGPHDHDRDYWEDAVRVQELVDRGLLR